MLLCGVFWSYNDVKKAKFPTFFIILFYCFCDRERTSVLRSPLSTDMDGKITTHFSGGGLVLCLQLRFGIWAKSWCHYSWWQHLYWHLWEQKFWQNTSIHLIATLKFPFAKRKSRQTHTVKVLFRGSKIAS